LLTSTMRFWKRLACAMVTTASLFVPAGARAEADPPAGRWYGWQTILVDAGAATAMLVPLALSYGVPLKSYPRPAWVALEGVFALGLGTYAVGPATVHLSHGEQGHAAGSVVLRIAGPLIGAGTLAFASMLFHTGRAACNDSYDGCVLQPKTAWQPFQNVEGDTVRAWAWAGVAAGAVVASAADAELLGRSTRQPARNPVTLRPDLRLGQTRTTVGVAGTF
jgi:hypothetical protein